MCKSLYFEHGNLEFVSKYPFIRNDLMTNVSIITFLPTNSYSGLFALNCLEQLNIVVHIIAFKNIF